MNPIELKYVSITYKEPVVYLKFKAGVELGFPEIKELVHYAEKLSDNKPYVVLSDVREKVLVTAAGRKYSAQDKNSPLQRGTAVLVNNLAYKLAFDIFTGIQTPEFPYSVFTEEKKALDWLLSLSLEEKVAQ